MTSPQALDNLDTSNLPGENPGDAIHKTPGQRESEQIFLICTSGGAVGPSNRPTPNRPNQADHPNPPTLVCLPLWLSGCRNDAREASRSIASPASALRRRRSVALGLLAGAVCMGRVGRAWFRSHTVELLATVTVGEVGL